MNEKNSIEELNKLVKNLVYTIDGMLPDLRHIKKLEGGIIGMRFLKGKYLEETFEPFTLVSTGSGFDVMYHKKGFKSYVVSQSIVKDLAENILKVFTARFYTEKNFMSEVETYMIKKDPESLSPVITVGEKGVGKKTAQKLCGALENTQTYNNRAKFEATSFKRKNFKFHSSWTEEKGTPSVPHSLAKYTVFSVANSKDHVIYLFEYNTDNTIVKKFVCSFGDQDQALNYCNLLNKDLKKDPYKHLAFIARKNSDISI